MPTPDIIFPSNNVYDIPCLLPELQPEHIELPCVAWGSRARGEVATGWHFYVDDYRFNALLKDPSTLPLCTYATEPNISIFDNTPRAVALREIHRKRWIARYWQSCGIQIIVDLNVPYRFGLDNLYGVPKGWRAFSTRAYANNILALEREYEIAHTTASPKTPLLLVTGGGKKARDACLSLPGTICLG